MAHEVVRIDIDPTPNLAELAREVRRTQTTVVLQEEGEDVAVLSPARPKRRVKGKRVTQEDIAASRAAAGSWKGLVDTEKLKRELDAARSDNSLPVRL
jgi:hypothetical protein